MRKVKGLFFVILCCCFVGGCLDEIDLDIPSGLDNGLVVQGIILKGNPSQVEILLRRLFNFDISSFAPINASEVIIRDSNDRTLSLRRRGEGIYRTAVPEGDPNFSIDYDLQYRVEILMPDGRQIHSTYEPLLKVPQMDSISHAIQLNFVESPLDKDQSVLDSFVRFSISTPVRALGESEPTRLRWISERTYKITELPSSSPINPQDTCYITEEVNIYDPQAYNPYDFPEVDYLSQQYNFDQKLSFRFAEGFYFSVYQETLSDGAYKYWSQINSLLNREGNMFEPQAGPIFSNLSNINDPDDPIYGYFYCTERDTIRQYISPAVYNQPPFCPSFLNNLNGELPFPKVCIDCINEIGAAHEPPAFWKPE